MNDSITLLLAGSAITLISSLATVLVRHWLDGRKALHAVREYPTRVLYDKQTEFFDRLAPVLLGLNSYITTMNVWFGESTPNAKDRIKDASQRTGAVGELQKLIDAYFMYLPAQILGEAHALVSECMFLSIAPSVDKTEKSIDKLFAFQNTIRTFVGVDRISSDLLKSFGSKPGGKSSI